jgi:hypothetical protein
MAALSHHHQQQSPARARKRSAEEMEAGDGRTPVAHVHSPPTSTSSLLLGVPPRSVVDVNVKAEPDGTEAPSSNFLDDDGRSPSPALSSGDYSSPCSVGMLGISR